MKKGVIAMLLSICINIMYSQTEIPLCYDLVWSDEFNGNSLDPTKWGYQNGGWSASNVQNCYTADNTAVTNGSLVITAKHEPGYNCFANTVDFTSGFVQTKNLASWTFGYFEARVKLPASNSTWPAFWLSPETNVYGTWPSSGEIDIFEIKGHDLTKSYANAFWGNSTTDKLQQKGPYELIGNASTWHVYGVEWSLGELKYYIDGVHYHTINDFKEPNAGTHPQPFDIPYYIRLNMAVGGSYLDPPWNDANNGLAQLPAIMEVDYVRVYQLNPTCTSVDNCELLQNGGFENGTTSWSLFSANGATGNISIDNDGHNHVDITNPGTSNWHLALRQTGIPLENGKTYEVSYLAYADANRSSNVILSQSNGTQYYYHSQALSTCPKYYSFQFTMAQPTDLNSYLNIGLGSTAIDAYFENISIREVSCIPCQYNYAILDQTIPVGTYQVENLIHSNSYVDNPTTVSFHANMIELSLGFETELGSIFEALIDPCSN